MHHGNVSLTLFLQIGTVPRFGSTTCSLKDRARIRSRVCWKRKWSVPPSVTDWPSHLSPTDGVALGKPHDLSLLPFLVCRIRKILLLCSHRIIVKLTSFAVCGWTGQRVKVVRKYNRAIMWGSVSHPFSLCSLGKKQRNKILAKLCDGKPDVSPGQSGEGWHHRGIHARVPENTQAQRLCLVCFLTPSP